MGTPIYKDYIPAFDPLVVERMRAAGVIIIGKTNVPEFGLESQTYNPIFGPTLEPSADSRRLKRRGGGGARPTDAPCG